MIRGAMISVVGLLILLVLFSALVVGISLFIAALKRKPALRTATICGGGVLVLVLMVGALSLTAPRSVQHDPSIRALHDGGQEFAMVQLFPHETETVVEQLSHASSWADSLESEQGFEADIYPSAESAAIALGRGIGERLERVLNETSGPNTAVIQGHNVKAELLSAVAQGLQVHLPITECHIFDPAKPMEFAWRTLLF